MFASVLASAVAANPAALQAFADHCFLPTMTAQRAQEVLASTGARHDFYDLDPLYASNAVSPPNGRAVTYGTDRRCEVSFDGDHGQAASRAAQNGLTAEGIETPAPVPASYSVPLGTKLLDARYLNPRRVAVVHAGTRPGPNGIETFVMVERLLKTDANK